MYTLLVYLILIISVTQLIKRNLSDTGDPKSTNCKSSTSVFDTQHMHRSKKCTLKKRQSLRVLILKSTLRRPQVRPRRESGPLPLPNARLMFIPATGSKSCPSSHVDMDGRIFSTCASEVSSTFIPRKTVIVTAEM